MALTMKTGSMGINARVELTYEVEFPILREFSRYIERQNQERAKTILHLCNHNAGGPGMKRVPAVG